MEVFIDDVVDYSGAEHHVDQGGDEGEENLEDENVRQSEQAHGAMFADGAFVFKDRLQNAEGPAEALTDEAIGIDRRLGECERAVFVDYAVALFEEIHGEVGIFGDGVGVIASAGLYRVGSPRANRAGDDHHDVEEVQRAAFEVLAGDVFERLPAGPEVYTVADFGVSGDGADLWIGEVRHQVGHGVVGDHSIGVDADVELLVDPVQRVVQRVGFATVGFGQHGEAAGGDVDGVGL